MWQASLVSAPSGFKRTASNNAEPRVKNGMAQASSSKGTGGKANLVGTVNPILADSQECTSFHRSVVLQNL